MTVATLWVLAVFDDELSAGALPWRAMLERRFLRALLTTQLYNASTPDVTAAPESTIVRICRMVCMVSGDYV